MFQRSEITPAFPRYTMYTRLQISDKITANILIIYHFTVSFRMNAKVHHCGYRIYFNAKIRYIQNLLAHMQRVQCLYILPVAAEDNQDARSEYPAMGNNIRDSGSTANRDRLASGMLLKQQQLKGMVHNNMTSRGFDSLRTVTILRNAYRYIK